MPQVRRQSNRDNDGDQHVKPRMTMDERVDGLELAAVNKVKRLFLRPTDPQYNADAAVPWNECSTATRAALALTGGVQAFRRAKQAAKVGPVVFGSIIIQGKIESKDEWEAFAKQQRAAALPPIDVDASDVRAGNEALAEPGSQPWDEFKEARRPEDDQ